VPVLAPLQSGNFVKKTSSQKDSLRAEYRPSDFPNGFVRGKYARKAAAASNIVVLEPELAAASPNSSAVNDALRAILQVAKHLGTRPC
jgi:hypothetical protein